MTYLTIDERKNTIIKMMRTLPTNDCARLLYDCAFDADILNIDDIITNCPDEQDNLVNAFTSIIKHLESEPDCFDSRPSDANFDYMTAQAGNRYFA